MKKSVKFKLFMAGQLLFFMVLAVSVNVSYGFETVCFRHKTTDRIKTGCFKLQGDAFPKYECPDEKGKLVSFPPENEKDEWEVTDCPKSISKHPDVPKGGTQHQRCPDCTMENLMRMMQDGGK